MATKAFCPNCLSGGHDLDDCPYDPRKGAHYKPDSIFCPDCGDAMERSAFSMNWWFCERCRR